MQHCVTLMNQSRIKMSSKRINLAVTNSSLGSILRIEFPLCIIPGEFCNAPILSTSEANQHRGKSAHFGRAPAQIKHVSPLKIYGIRESYKQSERRRDKVRERRVKTAIYSARRCVSRYRFSGTLRPQRKRKSSHFTAECLVSLVEQKFSHRKRNVVGILSLRGFPLLFSLFFLISFSRNEQN